MTRTSVFLTVCLLLICGTLPSQAQQMPAATTSCSYGYTSGSSNTYLRYCVTVNGNIIELETPQGHEQIEFGTIGEGYGICNETPATEYHDYAGFGDSGNWAAPTLLSHTATSVKIARTTSDGDWTLTQTITQVAPTSSIKIVMALRNNTSTARVAYLLRYADVSADGRFLNTLDSTLNTVAGWNTSGSSNPYGLQLQNVGTPPFSFWSGYAQNIPDGPNACNFAGNYVGGPLVATNGSLVMAYVGTVPAHGTRAATLTYRAF